MTHEKCNCDQARAAEAAIVQLRRERDEMRKVAERLADEMRENCDNCPAVDMCDLENCVPNLIEWAKGEL